MRDIAGTLLYKICDAVGTLSVFFIITDDFKAKYLVALGISTIISTLLPYEVSRKEG
ncbi:hypothetical protein DIGNKC_47 [Bacillus phage DIGNKC]|uniref:hypothetical protein n=1 Tax=Bacillus phage DIGNKC TaxID=1805948 RepID=UPI0007A772E3|nr:hypothetical protein BI007_gp047 [Bacillus phage DIGNKC]AMW62731.1 hypothetical protein DIGNKC_47 [Bacillus phage DIGNKC]